MYDDNFKNRIYLKAKESSLVGFLLIMLGILFIVPIILMFLLRFVLTVILRKKKGKVGCEESIYTNKSKATPNN